MTVTEPSSNGARKPASPGRLRRLALLALLVLWSVLLPGGLAAAAPTAPTASAAVLAGPVTLQGQLPGGAYYWIAVPATWNGTLLLYSHGYMPPGTPITLDNAFPAGDLTTYDYLLGQGYALAASSYSATGWALQEAFRDQLAVLGRFTAQVGAPRRTLAWGHSLGGIITAGLLQRAPGRFAGALPLCGVLAGGVGAWNEGLDAAFAFNALLAPAFELELVHIAHPSHNLDAATQALDTAQATPQGRARIALAAAMGDVPGWFDPASPEPAADDIATQEFNQYLWLRYVDFPFIFAFRAELEARAGGNPSWNTGVNYAKQLARSIDDEEVAALYAQAGLDLDADLAVLAQAPRLKADPGAVAYLNTYITFNGQIARPVLTLHTTGDGLVPVQNEQAYAAVVRTAGNDQLLRQAYVHRAGHCAFTDAETIAALDTLVDRLDTGQWADGATAEALNGRAAALAARHPELGATAPAFIPFEPSPFLRPFDGR